MVVRSTNMSDIFPRVSYMSTWMWFINSSGGRSFVLLAQVPDTYKIYTLRYTYTYSYAYGLDLSSSRDAILENGLPHEVEITMRLYKFPANFTAHGSLIYASQYYYVRHYTANRLLTFQQLFCNQAAIRSCTKRCAHLSLETQTPVKRMTTILNYTCTAVFRWRDYF